jgi:hypothetical protein
VLVKWWLLALPHYVIVAILAGGWHPAGTGGLIALLVLVAAVILLFSGTYPDSLFDFVMGLNRWCYRVLAYSALMRDEYPPFRLDSGGLDPGTLPAAPLPPPAGGSTRLPAPSADAAAPAGFQPVGAPPPPDRPQR